MEDVFTVQCPYCFEWVELYVDPDTTGRLVQDCDVCCHPWLVRIERSHDGDVSVHVDRAQ